MLHTQVLSRGSIVSAGEVNMNVPGSTASTFSIPLTNDMAPNARIVVYYVRRDGEVVADSISFDVQGVFRNQVK
jgi:CD109 antigen